MGRAGVHPPVLSAVVQSLTTKRGSFPQWQSRAGLYAALGAYGGGAWSGLAVGSHPSPSLSSLASEAVSFIAGSSGGITGEPHEGARKTGLAALTQWLPLLPRDDGGALIFPPGVLDFFVRGLVQRGEAGYFSALYFAATALLCVFMALAGRGSRPLRLSLLKGLIGRSTSAWVEAQPSPPPDADPAGL